jgi:secreted PhoX family phosphatase
MHMTSIRTALVLALAVTSGMIAFAANTKFSDFAPLTSSAVALLVDGSDEATPMTLSNPNWSQRSLADRRTQNNLVLNSNSGSFDMIASNATGPDAGRFLFMPFETGAAGVQRIDTQDPNYDTPTVTIVQPGTQGFVSGDASRWTPWGGYLTAEESWGTGSVKGRLFEVTDPIAAGQYGGNFVWRTIIPRVSHEGLAFDKDNTLYFVDELNGGSIYKYVSANPDATSGDEFFAAGQTFALRVGAGGQNEGNNGPAITGSATWVEITNATGSDGTSRTYNLNVSTNVVRLFAAPQTTDLATGAPAGGALRNADNLAIDHEGNMYIVEDRPGAEDDDIWFALDLNKDGDLTDAGEGIARWASNGTVGSEFTGLYFDLRNPNIAYVNIQHPDSEVDRTIEIVTSPNLERGNK